MFLNRQAQMYGLSGINGNRLNIGVTPQEGVVVEMNTVELPLYGSASEVRNDTGDAIFVAGLSPNS